MFFPRTHIMCLKRSCNVIYSLSTFLNCVFVAHCNYSNGKCWVVICGTDGAASPTTHHRFCFRMCKCWLAIIHFSLISFEALLLICINFVKGKLITLYNQIHAAYPQWKWVVKAVLYFVVLLVKPENYCVGKILTHSNRPNLITIIVYILLAYRLHYFVKNEVKLIDLYNYFCDI